MMVWHLERLGLKWEGRVGGEEREERMREEATSAVFGIGWAGG